MSAAQAVLFEAPEPPQKRKQDFATAALADPLKIRKNDTYETPDCATRALLRVQRLPRRIWEPACGPGAIVRVLRAAGHQVIATDLVDYGCEDSTSRVDFLMETVAPAKTLVTNPPFKNANEFVRHGLQLCDTVVMLLRLAFLEGAQRSDLIDRHLDRVWVGRERLPMMHRPGWDGPIITESAMPYAWFVFRKAPRNRPIRLQRMSWRDPVGGANERG